MGQATPPVVLAVDDDPYVLPVAVTVLTDIGYSVLEASSAAEALEVLREHPEISLLFTDIVMPGGMDGFELAHEAKQLRPELKVVYTSGYTRSIQQAADSVRYGPLIQKPWRQRELAQLFSGLLSSKSSGQQPDR